MADNIAITLGSGASLASDDIGGVHHQRVKLEYGPDGSASDVTENNGLPISAATYEVSGSATANNVNLVSLETTGYQWGSVQIHGGFTGTIEFQASNDNVNWYAVYLEPLSYTGELTTTATAPNIFSGPIRLKYLRLRTTAWTSGQANAIVVLSSLPAALSTVAVENWVYVFGGINSSADGSNGDLGGASMLFNGTNYDRPRTPTTLRTVTATASGDTAVWTPAAGKKHRLLRYSIAASEGATIAGGGVVHAVLRDGTTAIGAGISFASGGGAHSSGWVDVGNGTRSAAADQALNVNLSAALTAGVVRVNVAGTEE